MFPEEDSVLYRESCTILIVWHLKSTSIVSPKRICKFFQKKRKKGWYMILKKSMISIAAASLLAVGFVGCGDSTSTSTSLTDASNKTQQINTPKGTVTGLVQDTNGNPLAGVQVYLADMNTTTNVGGLYTFNDVPVSTTVGTDAVNASQLLSVTIAAPTGYLGATVTVTPSAQIDGAEDTAGGGTTSGSETFIDGYLAQAGTAVLPELNGAVSGTLRNAATGAPVANATVVLDITNGGSAAATAQEQAQDGVLTSYAVSTYKATTDANGNYSFSNIPSDSTFTAYIPGYNLAGGPLNAPFTTDTEETITQGDSTVTPIVSVDALSPFVVSTVGQLANNGASTAARQMLEDDVRDTIVINFSEPMVIEDDKDYTNSVIVKAGLTQLTDRSATVTVSPTSITVKLDTPLVDNEQLDINLLVTDFKDAAGNFIALDPTPNGPAYTGNIAYDSLPTAQILKLQYLGFNDLNTNAAAVTTIAQQNLDTNGIDDAAALQAKNSAFYDVSDSNVPNNTIWQMNSADDDDALAGSDVNARLTALGTAALGAAVTMVTDVPRISFTPSGAAAYQFKATRAGVDVNLPNGTFAVQNGATVATLAAGANNANGTATTLMTPANASDVTPVEFTISTGTVQVADTITITPIDDLGYAGTPTIITLVDNVAPTTALQRSYYAGAATAGTDNTAVVQSFGQGGELAGLAASATVGTPYLGINPGLLDNLNGTNTVSATQAGDRTLQDELMAHNTVDTTVTPNAPFIAAGTGIYDTAAYDAWNTDASLARTIGVSFSEDVDLNGTAPSFTGTNTVLSGFANNNDVVLDDNGAVVNVDLINVNASNVIKLANGDHGQVLSFTGVVDNAGNKADASANANVVIEDEMPPMVEKAEWNGTDVIVTFNEAIQLTDTVTTLTILDAAGANGQAATYATANAAKWVLSADKKTLTINTDQFSVVVGGGLVLTTPAAWTVGAAYAEGTKYSSTSKHSHLALSFSTVGDTVTTSQATGNTWAQYTINAAGQAIATPRFAIADTTPVFALTTTDPRWSYSAANRELTMTFTTNQAIANLNDVNVATGAYVGVGYALAGGDIDGTTAVLTDYFAMVTSAGTYLQEDTTAGEGFETGKVDLDVDGNDDVDFTTATSTIKFSNAGRTVTITLDTTIDAGSNLAGQSNVDDFFNADAATDVKTLKFIVGKGNSSDDSETNRRLEVIINNQ